MLRLLAPTFALFAALSASVRAQDLGSIVYSHQGGAGSVDVATGAVDAIPSVRPTSRSDYPGGRQYFVRETTGKAPGTDVTVGDHYLEDSSGNRVLVTAFDGPVFYTYRFGPVLLSNDGMDRFFSFWVYDLPNDRYLFYRAHLTPWDILAPGFVPLAMGDPRLELILVVDNSSDATRAMGWNPEGTGVARLSAYLFRNREYDRLLIHHVGPDVTPANDEVVNDNRLTGVRTVNFDFSPNGGDRMVVQTDAGRDGRGIAAWSRGVAGWSYTWVQKEYMTKNAGLFAWAPPIYSPDGTEIAFWGAIGQNRAWVYGIYRCPAGGGPIQPVLGFGTDNSTHITHDWVW